MMFVSPMWLIGAGLSLESMRRCFVGGTSLALFVDFTGLEHPSMVRDCDFLRTYLIVEEQLLYLLPPFLAFVFPPFYDYHNAACCFLRITDRMKVERIERECKLVWEKGD